MLQRQRSISQELVYNMMFIDERKKQEITNCLISNSEYAKIKHKRTGIYWNNQVNNYHMSFHPGGSRTVEGAMHIKYDVRDNYNRLRTITFPIHVYDTEYRNRHLTQNVMRFGQDIEIDLTSLTNITGYERTNILYLLGEIGDCLFQVLSDYLQSRDTMFSSGGRKGKTRIKRKNKKKTRKKKRTIKNKVNIKG